MWQKVPVVSNVDQVLRNVGSVSNKGWDFSIGGTPFSTRDFSWSINYTLNLNRNKILELDGINSTLIGTQLDYPGMVGSHIQRIGEPMATYLAIPSPEPGRPTRLRRPRCTVSSRATRNTSM